MPRHTHTPFSLRSKGGGSHREKETLKPAADREAALPLTRSSGGGGRKALEGGGVSRIHICAARKPRPSQQASALGNGHPGG